jgi:aspartate racemase
MTSNLVAPSPVLGVLGGMGPLATADFLAKLAARTPVSRESDHLTVAVWSNPGIPDRTAALLDEGPSPVPAMLDGIRRLTGLGAVLIAIPCNTAHAFLPAVRRQTRVAFVDMIAAGVAASIRRQPGISRLGVMATRGTRIARLYDRAAAAAGLVTINLEVEYQREAVDRAIALVKNGGNLVEAAGAVAVAAEQLRVRGAEAVVLGCSELPIVSADAEGVLPVVDATAALADAVIDAMRACQPVGSNSAGRALCRLG